MRTIENECVSCDLPCIDCGRKHVERVYCDCCGESLETCAGYYGVELEGEELCFDCAKNALINKYYPTREKMQSFFLKAAGEIDDDIFIEEIASEETDTDEIRAAMMDEGFEIIAEDCGANWRDIE